jgi:hypothetical protein
MIDAEILDWLLQGDVAVQFQVLRDLLDDPRPDLRARIATEGWGARFLAEQRPDGHWGRGYYQPKWTSTHYTLLDLRLLELPQGTEADRAIERVLTEHIGADGGVNPHREVPHADVCINGMVLDIATFFGSDPQRLHTVVDFVLQERMADGGFNCRSNRGGAQHSSVHTTLSVLEGIAGCRRFGYAHRLGELSAAAEHSREFLLEHRLFRSDRTGDVIQPAFLRLSFPGRWRYDVLRALEHFRQVDAPDPRLADALDVVRRKRRRDGRWNVQAKHPGATHFDMEQAGRPSRWNTLRALRVLRWAEGHGL